MEALKIALIFALIAIALSAEIKGTEEAKEEKKKEVATSDVKEIKKERGETNDVDAEVKIEEKKAGSEVKTEKKTEMTKKKQEHEVRVEEEEDDDSNVSKQLIFVFLSPKTAALLDHKENEMEDPKKQQHLDAGAAGVGLNGRKQEHNGLWMEKYLVYQTFLRGLI